jgi:hypothetical protein
MELKKQERNTPMMTIAPSLLSVAKQTLRWTALAGATLALGQAALAEAAYRC